MRCYEKVKQKMEKERPDEMEMAEKKIKERKKKKEIKEGKKQINLLKIFI